MSRALAVEGDKLTLTINSNSETLGKKCTGWSVKYTDPDGAVTDITSVYTIKQNESGAWDTVIKLDGKKAGGILLFTPAMEDCTEHSFITEGYVAPVCMYDGFEGYRVCEHCRTPDPEDTRSDEERVIPVAGKEADQWCLVCAAVFDGKAVPALGHNWVIDEANCTKNTTAYKCSRKDCSAAKYSVISETHRITVDGGYAYVGGKAVTKACKGETVTLKIAASSKLFKEWEVVSGSVVIANFTDSHSASFVMPDEDVTINAVFESHEHNFVWVIDKEATTADNGLKHEECTECGTRRSENTVIDKLSHSSGKVFIPNFCTLSFNTNGGKPMPRRAMLHGETANLAKYTPIRDGYEFTGWYSDAALTKRVYSLRMKSDATVYAGWEKIDAFRSEDASESD